MSNPLPPVTESESHTLSSSSEPSTSVRDSPSDAEPVNNLKRPPPFSRRVTKSLFIKPASQRPTAPNTRTSLLALVKSSWLNVLLVCNPIAWALHYTDQTPGVVFAVALIGVVPLAGMLGFGTEAVALYTGDALGGLINASLGNATEFIIAILLLVKCEIRVAQASLLGGLLSNLLLVLGMAFIVGGARRSELEFQQSAAQLNTSLLVLAVIALVIPSAFAFALQATVGADAERGTILRMSRGSSVILIVIYVSYMVFQLYSHRHYYNADADADDACSASHASSILSSPTPAPSPPTPMVAPLPTRRTSGRRFGSAAALGSTQPYHGRSPLPSRDRTPSVPPGIAKKHAITSGVSVDDRAGGVRARDLAADRDTEAGPAAAAAARIHEEDAEEVPKINLGVALGALIGATALTYVTAEALTDALEAIGRTGAVSPEWLGLILLAVVGNAAEHVTAVFVAYRNKVDLALAVAVGSCIQIALFVIPLLVLLGWAMGKPMSLLFDPLETLTLFLSVLLVRFATEDGRTHYMSGVVLLGTYVLIAFSFWFYPADGVLPSELYTCT